MSAMSHTSYISLREHILLGDGDLELAGLTSAVAAVSACFLNYGNYGFFFKYCWNFRTISFSTPSLHFIKYDISGNHQPVCFWTQQPVSFGYITIPNERIFFSVLIKLLSLLWRSVSTYNTPKQLTFGFHPRFEWNLVYYYFCRRSIEHVDCCVDSFFPKLVGQSFRL